MKEILTWQKKLDIQIRRTQFMNAIRERKTVEDAAKVFGYLGIDQSTRDYLYNLAEESDFSTRIRIYYYLSKLTSGAQSEELENRCFKTIKEILWDGATKDLKFATSYHIQKQEVQIELPVRVNYGGGWSDTPPYCNEMGGTVLNVAMSLRASSQL